MTGSSSGQPVPSFPNFLRSWITSYLPKNDTVMLLPVAKISHCYHFINILHTVMWLYSETATTHWQYYRNSKPYINQWLGNCHFWDIHWQTWYMLYICVCVFVYICKYKHTQPCRCTALSNSHKWQSFPLVILFGNCRAHKIDLVTQTNYAVSGALCFTYLIPCSYV